MAPIPAVIIDTRQIPPLEGKLIGKTFYAAMVEFYGNPENQRRFEEWQKSRGIQTGETQQFAGK